MKSPLTKPERQEWVTKIKGLNLSQPDASTCQSACIGMAVGDADVSNIRRKLLARGDAGSPYVMAGLIKTYKRPYAFHEHASLAEVYDWLKRGEFLVTHGWFTGSGHVICLDGLREAPARKGYDINVKDPWSEFNASAWAYNFGSKFYDGFYSDRLIYATCVAGTSTSSARKIYGIGQVKTEEKKMWVHRFMTD
jgi:hypothetical protein